MRSTLQQRQVLPETFFRDIFELVQNGWDDDQEYIHRPPMLWLQLSSITNEPIINDGILISEYEINNMLSDLIGNVEVGLTQDEIAKVSYTLTHDETEQLEEERCPVCLEQFIQNDTKNIVRLSCNHLFCQSCINKWLTKHKKCPCCQVDLEEKFIKCE